MQRISKRIHFIETSDKFTLVVSNGLPTILKYIFLAISICVLIGMISLIFADSFSYIYGFLYAFVAIAYLKRTLRKEIIEVCKNTLTIHQNTLFVKSIKTYLVANISHFRFAGENAFTPNALQVNNFDYLGVQTGERQLQEVIKDGTLEFFHQGVRVRFGMDVLSWEAEEIIFRIEKFTGNNLQIDDAMERLLNDLKVDDKQINSDTL